MKKIATILLILALATTATACSFRTDLTEEFEATVVDISVSAGGWSASTAYVVEFDNGKKFAFRTGQFVTGNRYYVKCYYSHNGDWVVDELELLEK